MHPLSDTWKRRMKDKQQYDLASFVFKLLTWIYGRLILKPEAREILSTVGEGGLDLHNFQAF